MRDAPLTVLKGGINRLRTKGGARADNLYDLLNGYLTDDGTAHVRPGTRRLDVLNTSTKGLTYFNGSRHVFAAETVAVPAGYTLHVLVNPNQEDGEDTVALKKIHFAEPFLGFLYVVAEFEDDTVAHYWLQEGDTWEANTVYEAGDLVTPSTPNGLQFQASRNGSPLPSWAPNVARAEGDQIEPTVYNNFYYTVIDTIGASPISGTVEPNWPTEEGAQIFEDTEGTENVTPVTTPPPSTQTPGSGVRDRYRRGGTQ